MTDKATMPEVPLMDKIPVTDRKHVFEAINLFVNMLRKRDAEYSALAAVAGRMAEAIDKFLAEPTGETWDEAESSLNDYNALAQSTQSPVEQPPARPEPADYKPDAVDKILKAAAKPATEYTVQEYMDKFHSNEQPPQTVAGDLDLPLENAKRSIDCLRHFYRPNSGSVNKQQGFDTHLKTIEAALTRHEGA